MKKSYIDIDFDLYYDAMKLCYHDEEWINAALNNRHTLKEVLLPITGFNTDKAVNNYLYSKNLAEILKNRQTTQIDENFINIIFNSGSEESKDVLINTITNKTYHNANILKSLLEEYSEKTRDFFDCKIKPYPETTLETTAPLSKFKITKEHDEENQVEMQISGYEIQVKIENDWSKKLNEYFAQRSKSKNMKRGYLSEQEISSDVYEFTKRQLVHVKEVYVPVSHANHNEGKYKVLYREKFVVPNNGKDITIDNKGLRVFYIGLAEEN